MGTRSDVTGALVFSKNGASIKINFVLNNDGHTATIATIYAKMYIQQRSPGDLAVEEREICNQTLDERKIPLAAEGGTGSREMNLIVSTEELLKGTQVATVPNSGFFLSPDVRNSYILPYLRGCVQYTYGPKYRERTFNGAITRIDGDTIDPNGGNIPAQNLKATLGTLFSN